MTGRCVFERKITLKRKFEPILLLYGLRFGRFSPVFPAFLSFLSLKTDFGLFLAYFVTIHSIYYNPVISYPQGILSYPQPISKLSTISCCFSAFLSRVIHMLSTNKPNRRNSAFACLSANISKVQHVSLNCTIYKSVIFIYIDLILVVMIV